MRHYSLLIDSRNHFNNDHLIGSIKFPKSASDLINLIKKHSRFFLIIAYQDEPPTKVLYFLDSLQED